MGRKKVKRNKIRGKKRNKAMETRFNCPVCNHENVVQCTVKKSAQKGYARCSVCEASYFCSADKLTAPIDIYSQWIDECYSE